MKRLVLSAVAVTLLSGTALAADIVIVPPAPPAPPPVIVVEPAPSKLYISTFGGLFWVNPIDVEAELSDPTVFVETNRGYRFGGAIGMQFTEMFGTELEVTFGRVTLDTVNPFDEQGPLGPPIDVDPATNSASLLTVMANLTVGFDVGPLRPYIALGGGAARLGINIAPEEVGGFPGNGANDTDWTWGVQALAGVDFAITDNISIGGRFRFQHIGPTDFVDVDGDPITLSPFNNRSVEGVLTIRF